ncbi:MAG: alpha-hydroxy-acid oxidizing protein, partial [Alphaproteobacteria bacterium]|nr:alpha-hydroxy-acid oxidizing protein [Alphaproteobacteria bacterium]
GALSGVRALPPIAEAVGDKLTLLMDGGVRSGLDVVRALALGARGVLIGRAWAYALAADGERGVARMLQILRQEMHVAMALTGHRTIGELDTSALAL